MAKENIARFFDAAMTDKVLAKRLATLAMEHGYDFTKEKMKMAKNNIIKFFNAITTNKELAGKVATLATEYGYDFTDAELLELEYAFPISDEETETIDGGRVTFKGPRFH